MDFDWDAFARLFWTTLLWGSWCVVHSLLNEEGLIRKTGIPNTRFKRYYRLAYSVFAVISLTAVWWWTPWGSGKPLWQWEGILFYVRLALIFSAIVIFFLSFQHIPLIDFLGLRVLGIGSRSKPRKDRLITWGVYAWIRHPQFLAGLVLLWSRDLKSTDLVINIVLSAYLLIGAHIEEKRLLAKYGKEYSDYMERVPRFLPVPGLDSNTDSQSKK